MKGPVWRWWDYIYIWEDFRTISLNIDEKKSIGKWLLGILSGEIIKV